jgi:hypothetical protein
MLRCAQLCAVSKRVVSKPGGLDATFFSGLDDLLAVILSIHGVFGGNRAKNCSVVLSDQFICILTDVFQEPISPLVNGPSDHIRYSPANLHGKFQKTLCCPGAVGWQKMNTLPSIIKNQFR